MVFWRICYILGLALGVWNPLFWIIQMFAHGAVDEEGEVVWNGREFFDNRFRNITKGWGLIMTILLIAYLLSPQLLYRSLLS